MRFSDECGTYLAPKKYFKMFAPPANLGMIPSRSFYRQRVHNVLKMRVAHKGKIRQKLFTDRSITEYFLRSKSFWFHQIIDLALENTCNFVVFQAFLPLKSKHVARNISKQIFLLNHNSYQNSSSFYTYITLPLRSNHIVNHAFSLCLTGFYA